jgi:uncharacterized protein YabN with tetrapyrrole methylase and pyrophosphatase domain
MCVLKYAKNWFTVIPHIYSDTVVKDEEEVKQNWEKLKLKKEDLLS